MGTGWWNKVVSWVGFGDELDEDDEERIYDEPNNQETPNRNRTRLLSIHSAPEVKIMVASPLKYEEAEKLVGHLKSRKPVIVNFEKTAKDTAQRIIDFMSGAAAALNGTTMKVTNDTFIFVPSNMSLYAEDMPQEVQDNYFFHLEQGGAKDR